MDILKQQNINQKDHLILKENIMNKQNHIEIIILIEITELNK